MYRELNKYLPIQPKDSVLSDIGIEFKAGRSMRIRLLVGESRMARILHIDDEQGMRRLVEHRLGKQGHEIFNAENGKIGVEKAQELLPDLILMDVDMPVMDGYEATSSLRRLGYKGYITAFTASERMPDLANAIVGGCDDFIPKPVTDEFEAQITAILEKVMQRQSKPGDDDEDDFFDDLDEFLDD